LLPQPPQFAVSFVTSSSQPSSGPVAGLAQFARPGLQADSQTPFAQSGLATPVVSHARAQAPQLATSPSVGVSHPSSTVVLQSPKSTSHDAIEHSVPMQPGFP
jgi:hypothetical protein